ncbi:MAG: response regulator [Lachnospiraceae bacterium]|nr:response regulator [Lachnospiraceae bacterium]
MKILIADDEEITRKGIIEAIDWMSLGIFDILEADDGINAIKIALEEKPDIILSDIRMPRLNGIGLAEQLTKALPNISLIFISGYSDKEYLKAAIRLDAVNYVEKPLQISQLEDALREAVVRHQQKLVTSQLVSMKSLQTSSKLALFFTKPSTQNNEDLQKLLADCPDWPIKKAHYVTYSLKLHLHETDSSLVQSLCVGFSEAVQDLGFAVCFARTHGVYLVFHIAGLRPFSDSTLCNIDKIFIDVFASHANILICRGSIVSSLQDIYKSYLSTALHLQNAFFFDENTVLKEEDFDRPDKKESSLPASLEPQCYEELLSLKDTKGSERYLNELYTFFYKNVHFLPNHVKDIYYRLFNYLSNYRNKFQLPLDATSRNIMDYFEQSFSYKELHRTLVLKNTQFFNDINSYVPENSTIFTIKNYIAKNYFHEDLSVKDISDYVFMSTSYICTYFKKQTGITLNQYITDYRMEKAKQLLGDARYQITDISSKVGYSNSNYFGKSFKKCTGYTPSEYRKKIFE